MADEIVPTWQSENPIPNEDFLYMRVHRQNFTSKYPTFSPRVFMNRGEGMSTDWSKHANPVETRNRGKVAKDNAVIRLLVKDIQSIENQIVEHTPDIPNLNRAHTDVLGEKDEEVRLKFSRISEIIIELED